MSVPSISRRPALGRSRAAHASSRVDLPDPDGPSSPTNSPGATVRLMPDSAATSWPSAWKMCTSSYVITPAPATPSSGRRPVLPATAEVPAESCGPPAVALIGAPSVCRR